MEEKKIKGRKRHISTDTMGNILYVKVHSANQSDTMIGRDIAYQTFKEYSSVRGFCADQGYCGTTVDFIRDVLNLKIDITKKPNLSGFQVLPKRWIVERNFAWMGNFRRLSKDYEVSPRASEYMIMISSIMLLLNKIF